MQRCVERCPTTLNFAANLKITDHLRLRCAWRGVWLFRCAWRGVPPAPQVPGPRLASLFLCLDSRQHIHWKRSADSRWSDWVLSNLIIWSQLIISHLIILQGVFSHWYPPKKLKYGKPRLGESTLTYIGQDTPNLVLINLFVLWTFWGGTSENNTL